MLEVVTSEEEELPRTGFLANPEVLARQAATAAAIFWPVLAGALVIELVRRSRFSGGSSTEQTSTDPE